VGKRITSGEPQVSQEIEATKKLWPDVTRVPRQSIRTFVAERLFKVAASRSGVTITLDRAKDPAWLAKPGAPTIHIYRPKAFFTRLGSSGLIGLGESYMAGEWDSEDLPAALARFSERLGNLVPPALAKLRAIFLPSHPETHINTIKSARKNIEAHYDLSNDLFRTFLDETLTYSSALFTEEESRPFSFEAKWEDLATASRRKIDRLLDRTGVLAGSHVLEIGSGWGELAVRAARRGAHVTTLTLSKEQAAYIEKRIVDEELTDLIEVQVRDYREAEGNYDAIVSVEMIEAVGKEHWVEYYQTIDRLLAPNGMAGIQAITMPHERMLVTANTYTWIQKYIFPGGFLPSRRGIHEDVEKSTSLRVVEDYDFGLQYAETLRLWRERFDSAATHLDTLGFDEIFRRMWRLYLAYSEAGFRSGYLNVSQILLARAR
jgi:cyclopropane-fatty-acyl-phospholipid synthase